MKDKIIFIYLKHDAALDYYGLKLATCSSDRSVKIHDASKELLIEIEKLKDVNGELTNNKEFIDDNDDVVEEKEMNLD